MNVKELQVLVSHALVNAGGPVTAVHIYSMYSVELQV